MRPLRSRLLLPILAAGLIGLAAKTPAAAQADSLPDDGCHSIDLTSDTIAAWFNPKPDEDDFVLDLGMPIPGFEGASATGSESLKFAFKSVPLSGTSFFGDDKSVFEIGSEKPKLFENRHRVRIGSAAYDSSKSPRLLFGKYESTVVQYALVVGDGDLQAGVSALIRETGRNFDPALTLFVDPDSACRGVVTPAVSTAFRRPLTGLTLDGFHTFVSKANTICFSNRSCSATLAGLSINPDIPAVLRIPTDHEWEYVARGGYQASEDTRFRLPAAGDKLILPDGSDLSRFAHFTDRSSSKPTAGPMPIGLLAPLYGFHDLYGNAQELTTGWFLSETIYGAAGGLSARGGSVRTPSSDLRPSYRAEIPPYRRELKSSRTVAANLPDTTVRLTLGVPIAGATKRLGSDELEKIFDAAYSDLETGKDRAGDRFAEARILRVLKESAETFFDELGGADQADFFQFSVAGFSTVTLSLAQTQPIRATVYNDLRQAIFDVDFNGASESDIQQAKLTDRSVGKLLPGLYYLALAPIRQSKVPTDLAYGLRLTSRKAPDTGLSGGEINRRSFDRALRFGDSDTITVSGYVGPDDRFDTFPIILDADHDGIQLELGQGVEGVKIHVLDVRGKRIASKGHDGVVSSDYPVPLYPQMKAFLQVEADEHISSRYVLDINKTRMFSEGLEKRAPSKGSYRSETVMNGYLHEDIKQLFHKTELLRRSKLLVELSGLHGDVDMTVYDHHGKAIASDHRRTGTDPEVFQKTLSAGTYTIALTRKSGRGTMTPFDLAVFHQKPDELTMDDIESARSNARRLVADIGPRHFQFDGGIAYFYFDPPASITRYRVRLSPTILGNGEWTIEDPNGNPLARESFSVLGSMTHVAGPDSGRTYLRIQNEEGKIANLAVSLISIGGLPKRSPGSITVSGTAKDWTYGVRDNKCVAYSHAREILPASGWLTELPMFYISVDHRGNGAYLEAANQGDFDSAAPITARIANSRGNWRKIKLTWERGVLKAIRYDKKKRNYVLHRAVIRAIRAGSLLEIRGNTHSGKPVKVVYSLAGITAATNKLVALCRLKSNVFR